MSDWITSMTIVDGNGDIKIVPDDYITGLPGGYTKRQILKAASVSLGLFGVKLLK